MEPEHRFNINDIIYIIHNYSADVYPEISKVTVERIKWTHGKFGSAGTIETSLKYECQTYPLPGPEYTNIEEDDMFKNKEEALIEVQNRATKVYKKIMLELKTRY